MKKIIYLSLFLVFMGSSSWAQVDEDQLGAWYMYFWSASIKDGPWGFQGDIQHRNWDAGGDLEQLLLRGGLTYTPKDTDIKFTFGYGHITTGAFGDDKSTVTESRIYQEALFPKKIGGRFYTNHRFRYEQRWVQDQDTRTRYRYNIFLNVPLNDTSIGEKTLYLAFYNEIFINGQRDIGGGNMVEVFDRNRTYFALGYGIKNNLKVQAGIMNQVTNSIAKKQAQLSLHHNF